MPLEPSFSNISDLNPLWPSGGDPKNVGDDHIRGIKQAIENTFPNITGVVTPTHLELNKLTGATLSTLELNKLTGATLSTIELNKLTGALFSTVEANYLVGVTSAIQTQINSKGALAGANWTGAQNFAGAVTTVAPPVNPTDAVTLFAAQQMAYSNQLPNQAGNAGRFMFTDGTNASWADLSGGLTVTSSAVPILLTVASRQVQVVTMTADDQSVVLPDATTISVGLAFTIYNKGTKAFSVRNKGDAFLVSVASGQIATFYCYDKTTLAGFWFVGNESYTGGSLTDSAVATAAVINAVSSQDTSVTRISDTVAIAAYRGTSGFAQAVCLTISAAAIVAGAVLTINAVAVSPVSIATLTAAKVVVAYGTATNPQAVVLTLSGTTLTAGSAATVVVSNASASGVTVAALSATQAIVAALTNTVAYAQTIILDISGTVITPSAPLVLNAVGSQRPAVTALTATKALVVFLGASGFSNSVVVDVSGNTMTPGSVTAFTATNGQRTALITVSATRALYASIPTSLNVYVLDVSGTTVTPSALTTIDTGLTGGQVSISLMSSTRAIVLTSSATLVRGYLVSISGSTPTVAANFMPTLTGNFVASVGLTATKAIAVYAGTSGFLTAQIIEKAE